MAWNPALNFLQFNELRRSDPRKYRLNFDRNAGRLNMPELAWPYGYLIMWLVMIAIAGAMFCFCRERKWF